jgi:hypothetical protein
MFSTLTSVEARYAPVSLHVTLNGSWKQPFPVPNRYGMLTLPHLSGQPGRVMGMLPEDSDPYAVVVYSRIRMAATSNKSF